MKKSEWSDNQLEELLQHLPKVKDKQDPDELFRKISSRIQVEQIRDSGNRKWILPSVAAVAALFIILIIGPTFLNKSGGNLKESASFDTAASEKQEFATESASENDKMAKAGIVEEPADDQEQDPMSTTMEMPNTSNIVHDVGEGQTLVTIGIMDSMAQNVVPLSFLSTDMTKTKLEVLQDVIQNLPASDLGLDPTKLDGLRFEEVDMEKVLITIPSDYTIESSSAQIGAFFFPIIETFRWMGYKVVELRTEEGEQAFIDPVGPVEPIDLSTETQKGYYIYTTENGHTYLVPSRDSSATFEEALSKMRDRIIEYELKPSIPIEYEYTANSGTDVTVAFTNEEFSDQNDPKYRLMIEAILLTAKEFGFKTVTFINTPEQIGGINLIENGKPKPVNVPIAPNPIELPATN